jgi:hypothetical protein
VIVLTKKNSLAFLVAPLRRGVGTKTVFSRKARQAAKKGRSLERPERPFVGKEINFLPHKRPSVPRRFHRPPASLESSDLEGKKRFGRRLCPPREAAAGFSLPRLSCGKLKRLYRLSRCVFAPWREAKKQFSRKAREAAKKG